MKPVYSFPVEKILYKVHEELPKAVTVGILEGFKNGLQNEIEYVDLDGGLTTVAEVSPAGRVSLSLAYCQFLLMMCHVGLIIHESIAVESALESMSNEEKEQYYKELEKNSPETRYLREVPNLEDAKRYCSNLIDIAKPLLNSKPLTQDEFEEILQKVDYNSELSSRANSLCVYGIVFTLLHEASHVILGQKLDEEGSVQEEIDADHNAFWALCNDFDGKERNTAMMGCLCALASLLFINPSLCQDPHNPHPREDDRLFSFYDILKTEKHSYTEMLVFLLITWATVFSADGFPVLSDSYQETLERQRAFFAKVGKEN